MAKYMAYDIDYDTDGQKIENLPTTLVVEIDDDANPIDMEIAEKISDKTGWLVNKFQYSLVEPELKP